MYYQILHTWKHAKYISKPSFEIPHFSEGGRARLNRLYTSPVALPPLYAIKTGHEIIFH